MKKNNKFEFCFSKFKIIKQIIFEKNVIIPNLFDILYFIYLYILPYSLKFEFINKKIVNFR